MVIRMQNYTYSSKFSGNVLIVGRTECGKTTFMQKLALHTFFGKLKKQNGYRALALQKKEKLKFMQIFLANSNSIIWLTKMNLMLFSKN